MAQFSIMSPHLEGFLVSALCLIFVFDLALDSCEALPWLVLKTFCGGAVGFISGGLLGTFMRGGLGGLKGWLI